eukprot:CAMPEP_0119430228 /NCGR_PEP_ID=MMETSP1335-20130426/43688_1 /TAXON_ID=259385 /ORGANISM="Chrysoculter rhomboideus, Strain RCC1486" /LENGTH=55 /DNA_ID=CAMNT_0007455981 /DNA_START=29 /DNA_END=196 /DNA_ORIENTATION=+
MLGVLICLALIFDVVLPAILFPIKQLNRWAQERAAKREGAQASRQPPIAQQKKRD